jgi:hypothetical protein
MPVSCNFRSHFRDWIIKMEYFRRFRLVVISMFI